MGSALPSQEADTTAQYPRHHLPGPAVQGDEGSPWACSSTTGRSQLRRKLGTLEHLARRAARPTIVPPTALPQTNEIGPRPPRSADFTSGPAPTGLRCLSRQLSVPAWSGRRRPSERQISFLVELEETKLS